MATTYITGRRIHPGPEGYFVGVMPGDYWQDLDGQWWCCPPAAGVACGVLSNHSVTEHEDGTITVSPAILMPMSHARAWHGYLEHGVWGSSV